MLSLEGLLVLDRSSGLDQAYLWIVSYLVRSWLG